MTFEVEDALARELRQKATGSATYQQDRTWARFSTWCDDHGLDTTLPVSETTILLYLHDHYPNWSWSYARHISKDIGAIHTRHGFDDPAGTDSRTYLARLRRDVGSVKREPTDPIRIDDAATIAKMLSSAPTVEALREIHVCQSLLLVARAANMALKGHHTPAHLPAEAFKVTRQCVILTPTGGKQRFIVADRDRTPRHYEALVGALTTDDTQPLGMTSEEREHRKARIVSAWKRAGQTGPAPMSDVASVDQDVFDAWVRALDAHLERRVETAAFVLLGVLLARRAVDLCRLDFEHISTIKGGYRLDFPITKTDPFGYGGGLVKYISHVQEPDGACKSVCPACALELHIDIQRAVGRTSGPVFRGYGGNGGGRLTVHGALERLRAAWKRAGLDPSARIGSRSLRAGGATSASEAGWSLLEIAHELTDHKTLAHAAVYVRRNNPLADQATLDL